MYTQHSALIIAHVSPYAAVRTSKAILFCRTALRIRETSILSKEMLFSESLSAFAVYLLRASTCQMTSSCPKDGAKMDVK